MRSLMSQKFNQFPFTLEIVQLLTNKFGTFSPCSRQFKFFDDDIHGSILSDESININKFWVWNLREHANCHHLLPEHAFGGKKIKIRENQF